ncbi:MAG: SDR family NAD(P)-dependent oxidoreductase [Thermoanaerobaculaceae bacterium]
MRTVLITGAASGIGLACARRFLGEGDRVVAHFRSHPKALLELQNAFPGRLLPVRADLATEDGCVSVFRDVDELQVLVHAAGVWNAAPLRQINSETLESMFRTNTFSGYFLAREAAKRMMQGSMIFIGSTAGQRGEPFYSHYAGSKAALWGLVQSAAQELAPGIRVNLVSPGWVRTPMAAPTLGDPEKLGRILDAIPLKRVAEPEDVASVVSFLASDGARHITGADIPVSGGALLPLPRG